MHTDAWAHEANASGSKNGPQKGFLCHFQCNACITTPKYTVRLKNKIKYKGAADCYL